MARLSNIGKQFFDSAGDPLAGGKLYFYATGTTTLATTYSDDGLTTANANPVVLDAAGRMGDVFYAGFLKIVLTDANDVVIETRDPVGFAAGTAGIPNGGTTDQVLVKLSNTDQDVGWGDDQTGGGGSDFTYDWTPRDASFTAVAGTHYYIDGGNENAVTMTLPASPSAGDKVGVYVGGQDENPIVNENGEKYVGNISGAGDFYIPESYGSQVFNREPRRLVLIYANSSLGWMNLQGELLIAGS